MPTLDYVWPEDQVVEMHERALRIFGEVTKERELPEFVQQSVYNSIINMVGQARIPNIVPGIVPRMDIPRG